MKINALRSIARCLTAALVVTSTFAPAFAADASYPNRPLRIIVTTAPGGGPDIMARLIGQRLAQTLGQQVVIDNRAGASGIIGAEVASQATPDGYTFMLATGQHSIVQGMYEGRLKYHLARDFAPIVLIATTPFVLVINPSLAAHSVEQLIALAKAKPGELRYGSGGAGSPPHLSAEVFKSMTGTDLQHIPYKGIALAMNDAELARAFNTPEFQARFSDLGVDPGGGTPGEFRTFMIAHMEKMRKAVVASGARPE